MWTGKTVVAKGLILGILAAIAVVLGLAACGGGGGGTAAVVAPIGGGGAPPAPVGPVVPPTCTTTGSGITLSLVASRLTGVAPLAVFFDATATTATATTRPFHELEYRWSFGDAGSGSWGDKTTGSAGTGANTSRNAAYGPVSAHVFETPGTYTVTLSVFDGTNTVTNNCAVITVTDPNTVYAGANTVCISAGSVPTAGAGGCPAGATVAQTADFCAAVTARLGTGKRVLFNRGETYACASSTTAAANGPWTIGAYGAGAAPRISSNQVGGGVIGIGAGPGVFPADGRIMDLEITSSVAAPSSLVSIAGVGNFNQLTLLNLNIHDVGDGPQFVINNVDRAGNTGTWDQISIVDSTVRTVTGGSGAHGVYAFVSRFALLGNLIEDTVAAEHLVRLDYLNGAVINHNVLRTGPSDKETIAIRGLQQDPAGLGYAAFAGPAPSPTQNVVVSDNSISISSDNGIRFGPANSTIVVRIQNVVTERNFYSAPVTVACAGGLCAQTAIDTQADGHTSRNELINWSNFRFYNAVATRVATTGMAAATNVDVYNNSAFSNVNSSNGTAVITSVNTGVTNMKVKNNLAYVPNITSTAFPVFCFPAGACGAVPTLVQSNNSTDTQMKTVTPNFTSTPPVALTDWRPAGGSYAIGAGALVPVWSDFFRAARPPHDLGAVLP